MFQLSSFSAAVQLRIFKLNGAARFKILTLIAAAAPAINRNQHVKQALAAGLLLTVCLAATPAAAQTMAWVKGSNEANQPGTYGTQGTAAASNTPGARTGSVSWTDSSGNFWLFGGRGYDAAASKGILNDLWKYHVASGNWTWMTGSNTTGQPGTYGTQGVADAVNTPGARSGSVSWNDPLGNLWLFGGEGQVPGTYGRLNDLWKYDVASGNWTWMKGSNTTDQPGTYGTRGTAAVSNTPGARIGSVSWTDSSGNLWLFGGGWLGIGQGTEDFGLPHFYDLNDLWNYDMASGNWTWMKGSNSFDQPGTYGTQGTAAATNTPGGRHDSVSWNDGSDNLWLFGGRGHIYEGDPYSETHNDLWKYDVATGNWTWMKGSRLSPGSYGTQGTPAPGNAPGARYDSVSWTDASGDLWLFGGFGYSDGAPGSGSEDYLNELWKYDVASGNWAWMKGTNNVGTYGTQGTADAANIPSPRTYATGRTGPTSTLYLFGGNGSENNYGDLNDLWAIYLNVGPSEVENWFLYSK